MPGCCPPRLLSASPPALSAVLIVSAPSPFDPLPGAGHNPGLHLAVNVCQECTFHDGL